MREYSAEKVKYTSEIRERTVQLVIESQKYYPSSWATVSVIAPKIGCIAKVLRVKSLKYLDKQNPLKIQEFLAQEPIKQLECENIELQRANEILCKVADFSPRRSSTAHTNNCGFHL